MAEPENNNETKPIDTGAGGFVVDDKIYSMTPGDADRNEDTPNAAGKKGDISVDQNNPPVKDIAKNTRVTLGNYLGQKTHDAKNYYKISQDSADGETKKLSINGYPVGPEQTENKESFVQRKNLERGISENLTNWKSSNNAFPSVRDNIPGFVKGKSEPNTVFSRGTNRSVEKITGNELLNKEDLNSKPVVQPYIESLLSMNRFSSINNSNQMRTFEEDSFAAKSASKSDGVFSTENISSQQSLNSPNTTFYSPKFGQVNTNTLSHIGGALMSRASGIYGSSSDNFDPSGISNASQALAPTFQQFGASKVETAKLELEDIVKNLTSDPVPESQFIFANESINTDKTTWGSLYSPYQKFLGIDNITQRTIQIAANYAGIRAITGVLYELFKPELTAPEQNDDNPPKRFFGASKNKDFGNNNVGDTIIRKLGLETIDENYLLNVNKGLDTFFLDTDSIFSSEQIVITSRAILRTFYLTILASKQLSNPVGSNAVAATKAVLSFVESKTASLFKMLNVFAVLGSSAGGADNKHEVSANVSGSLKEYSYLNGQSDLNRNNPSKKEESVQGPISGFRTENRRMSWASRRTSTVLLAPASLIFTNTDSVSENLFKQADGSGLERITISDEEVKTIEKALSAEYIPFYFHDLRTKEIISFHAFLESLTDNFSANYESSEGIGRIEPVLSYKGTTRNISMTFTIVATSPEDFEVVWQKINKLTTLVYPQYTEGRKIKTLGHNEITQPFSQLVGSSPLVRIRVGNVIRGNYSKFALARLFGAHLSSYSNDTNSPANPFHSSGGSENALVKSFATTAGEGLAGFIEGLVFNWLDEFTWDIDNKAPTGVKVSISGFKPIHDISPGIDSNGYNRAPIYPVGRFSDKRK